MKNRLGLIRKRKRFTQTQLARVIGISRPHLSNIERGKKKPGVDVVLKIASALNEPVEKIFLPLK